MKILGILGSLGLFLGVALGAFGAHFLRGHLSEEMQNVFETAVRYQMYHSIAIVLAAILVQRNSLFMQAGIFYVIGILLFSGSLYALALTNMKALGIITPFGGLSFLIGHAVLLVGFLRTM